MDGFNVNPDGSVKVFTDGCCANNGQQGARAGVGVWFGHDSNSNISAPVQGRATNNAAEIQAVTRALNTIREAGHTKAEVNTDSKFVIQSMTQWKDGWKQRGWKKADGSDVVNRDDFIDLDMASQGMTVKYNHVKGHSRVHGNEMADQLAKQGARQSRRY